jgi:hypothetical protein
MSNRYAEQEFDRRYGAETAVVCRRCQRFHTNPCKQPADQPLTAREAEILKVACAAYYVAGGLEHIVTTRLKMRVNTFWQIVNELIDTERGLAFDPVNVNRLRRLRDTRRKP